MASNPVRLQLVYDPPGAASPLVMGETSDNLALRTAAELIVADAQEGGGIAAGEFLRKALRVLVPELAA